MNKFLVFIFFSTLIFAVPDSKDDIKILINYMDKKFDDVNQKFNFRKNIIIVIIGFMAIMVTIGIWNRYTVMKETKKEIALEVEMKIKESKEKITLETISKLKEKVDKSILEKIALILEKVVEGNSEAKEIFSKHRFIFS